MPDPEEPVEDVEVEVRLPNGQSLTILSHASRTLRQLKQELLSLLKYAHDPPCPLPIMAVSASF